MASGATSPRVSRASSMKRFRPWLIGLLAICAVSSPSAFAGDSKPKTENVVIVMIDGLRWQEVFQGADDGLLNADRGGVHDVETTKRKYWRPERTASREVLMPFVWTTIGKEGQLFGNRRKGSSAKVTNGLNFSYPGYQEALCGFVDSRINSNDKVHNPNATVLEWLNDKPAFHSRVAAFASWEVFPYILNTRRSHLYVNAGTESQFAFNSTETLRVSLTGDSRQTREDALTFRAAHAYLKDKKPRVLFVCFDETDVHAHAGRYDRVLAAAHQADAFVRIIWETVQASDSRDKTTLIVLPDHGRGRGPMDWKDHGERIEGSDNVWMAFLGPDTPAWGEREECEPVTESQLASTIAGFLGYDYGADVSRAAKPISQVFRNSK